MASMASSKVVSNRSAARGLRSRYHPKACSFSASASGWIVTSTTRPPFQSSPDPLSDHRPGSQLDRTDLNLGGAAVDSLNQAGSNGNAFDWSCEASTFRPTPSVLLRAEPMPPEAAVRSRGSSARRPLEQVSIPVMASFYSVARLGSSRPGTGVRSRDTFRFAPLCPGHPPTRTPVIRRRVRRSRSSSLMCRDLPRDIASAQVAIVNISDLDEMPFQNP